MKLLFCKKCNDVFSLREEPKKCSCGAVEGKYIDGANAEYSGDAIPFAIDNHSFAARADNNVATNELYDAWHGRGKIQCWLLREGSPNFETIKQIEKNGKRPAEFFTFRDSLFSHHKKRIKNVPDAKAQMIAITALFDAQFAQADCLTCYDKQVSELQGAGGWRSKVSWLTVKADIGDWIAQGKPLSQQQRSHAAAMVGKYTEEDRARDSAPMSDNALRARAVELVDLFYDIRTKRYDDSDLHSWRNCYSAEEWQRFCAIYEEEKQNFCAR